MNRLTQALQKDDLFIPFITAGDPSLDVTIALLLSLQKQGADVIELGVPYSDPLADGPTIQAASIRAIQAGTTLPQILEMIPLARKKGVHVPIILFTYANPLYQYGFETFVEQASTFEVDGVLVPDLPFEEAQTLASLCKANGLSFISMVAPTSRERIKKIASSASGFLYCVSTTGVTGARDQLPADLKRFIQTVKQHAQVPCVVGFGIHKREQVDAIQQYADGVVIGSAIVKEIEKRGERLLSKREKEAALAEIEQYIGELQGINTASY
ncbi:MULTISPECIES: tryptophan synthase subunit alpha [Shouchella]|uniref:Tryptophan synthase alpha chain n=2 Tax=Shouchella TaxID=2893057 RepID=A0ABY7W6R2_9BACI|nr:MULTISPECIES: tryptophan synthase subunit alpha [Shouchella]MED4127064.1 tryptophan synthase subunit alpha [Shouchella miscanthi]WDF03552.1 tryptophan synthase subunit alpha [Shouchella hunanensis]GAF24325.1 LOW QUALITY PROTEIN: tryptophan synthase alpha chain [Bacillus sp. JCM 19047]